MFQALSLAKWTASPCVVQTRELSVVKDAQPPTDRVAARLTRMGQRLFDLVVGLTEAIPGESHQSNGSQHLARIGHKCSLNSNFRPNQIDRKIKSPI